jgi:putative colanic acid biosynthesis acetyltransferase WcaF
VLKFDVNPEAIQSRKSCWQDLSSFRTPAGFRGRSAWIVQLWWLVQSTLFAASPQFMFGWRRWLLRLFGAKVGVGVLVRPSVRTTYPWKVRLDDYCWIGDEVQLYSLGEIHVGEHAVVSQRSYLCTGSHRHDLPGFDITAAPIVIGAQAWVGTDVFVAPGITIGEGAVVGARSSVFHDLPAAMICKGSPAKPYRARSKAAM